MPSNAKTVADYILAFFQNVGDPIPLAKLQKLLYYVQGWHLARHDAPAFPERIEAWLSGPICPEIYEVFQHHSWRPIFDEVRSPQGLDAPLIAVIDEVIDSYGVETGWCLQVYSRRESPWIEARKGLSNHEQSTEEITHDSMRRFFLAEAAAEAAEVAPS